ncbi:NAD(P)/FAD-dependent oxidoreductase [Kineosporia succinea]|uniref:Thioredoxin reductase (NADPH) n=1 Tax=Kineosporia succinea TaxID=84632 RepID=A0ABT9P2D5_9ACTN|nr:FAD-dependent oxidoreductase [Kineosporia succinea]MDP9826818.1 thioredoxin reductase (NADPH) [Kineosporia succinea]
MSKPILLTVDDDPSVSRAVARDLRRRYAEQYRVVRADSGAEALESLQEIRLRGDRVAVLLADYRMPGMNGIEFLERAMDLFPRARRALLTAYADTDAAIEAINVVDVDYYLLKPWEPPEEKLYPVVDQMLETWAAAGDPEIESTRIIGHRWSSQAHEVRDFLARSGMPYHWYTVEEDEGRKLLQAAGATEADVPVLLTAGGDVLRNPSLSQVADKIGLSTTPAEDFYDLIIVGGGPAGLGAAVYGASEGLRTVLVEGRVTGGQAGQSSRIENYLGFPEGVSGGQLTDRARRQASRLGAELLTARRVVGLETHGPKRIVELDDGRRVAAHAVLLATGVSYRRLRADGADDMVGKGVFYGSAATEAEACADQHVVIVGGANSAGQAAMFFSRQARKVTLAVRGPDLERSMSHYLIQQIRGNDRIDVRTCTEVASVHGDGHLEKLVLRDTSGGTEEDVDCGHLFVFIGAAPLTDWLPDELERDEAGFLLTGTDLLDSGRRPAGWAPSRDPFPLETSIPGVFVAGDVRSASVKRVASAVGEGAMAVSLVHQYLAHP